MSAVSPDCEMKSATLPPPAAACGSGTPTRYRSRPTPARSARSSSGRRGPRNRTCRRRRWSPVRCAPARRGGRGAPPFARQGCSRRRGCRRWRSAARRSPSACSGGSCPCRSHGAVVGGDALRTRDRPAARLAHDRLAGAEYRPVALVEIADPPGESRERQRVRGEIGGVVAVPDGERGTAPGADQEARVACEDDRERKRAFELLERLGRGRPPGRDRVPCRGR